MRNPIAVVSALALVATIGLEFAASGSTRVLTEIQLGELLLIGPIIAVSTRLVLQRTDNAIQSRHGASLAGAIGLSSLLLGHTVAVAISCTALLLFGLSRDRALNRLVERDLLSSVLAAAGVHLLLPVSQLAAFVFACAIFIVIPLVVRAPYPGPCKPTINLLLLDCGISTVLGALLTVAIWDFTNTLGIAALSILVVGVPLIASLLKSSNNRNESLLELADLVDINIPGRLDHSRKVATLAAKAARVAGLSRKTCRLTWWGGRVADLGLPFTGINTSKGSLSADELRLVRLHAARSSEMLDAMGMSRQLREIVLCHHERPDGQGFLGRPVQQVPLASSFVSAADAYVAMRADRAHRPSLSSEAAVTELETGSNKQFVAEAVAAVQLIIESERHGNLEPAVHAEFPPSSQREFEVIAFDPQIEDNSYRLRIVQNCSAAILNSRVPAIYVRDSRDSAEFEWLSMPECQIWAPGTMRISGTPIGQVFRYVEHADQTDIKNALGSTVVSVPRPSRSEFAWRLLSKDTLLKTVLKPGVAAVAVSVGLLLFVTPVYHVPTGSMQPTLWCGDYIATTAIGSFRDDLKRGDVVVIHDSHAKKDSPTSTIVKRIVAVAGDIVESRSNELIINGRELGTVRANNAQPPSLIVPRGTVYLVGDNSIVSDDSRSHGPVHARTIVSKVHAIIWPPSRIGLVSNKRNDGNVSNVCFVTGEPSRMSK